MIQHIDIWIWTAPEFRFVSLSRHALQDPFTVEYEGIDVTIAYICEVDVIDVVRPRTKLQNASLQEKKERNNDFPP